MKSYVNKKWGYPKLMRLDGSDKIVLFTSPKVGFVVHGGEIGKRAVNWDIERFRDFDGEVTLSN